MDDLHVLTEGSHIKFYIVVWPLLLVIIYHKQIFMLKDSFFIKFESELHLRESVALVINRRQKKRITLVKNGRQKKRNTFTYFLNRKQNWRFVQEKKSSWRNIDTLQSNWSDTIHHLFVKGRNNDSVSYVLDCYRGKESRDV